MSQSTPEIITGSTAPGGSTMQASENAHKAAATSNSGTAKPSYSEAGTTFFNTTDDVLTYENNAGASVTVAANSVFTESADGLVPAPVTEAGKFLKDDGTWATPATSVAALPADDATPSVLGGGVFEEVYTTPTTVTALDDGVKGDKVTIMFTTSNLTVAAALTKTGMTIPCIAGDIMEWTHNGTVFKQTGGTVGMGQFIAFTTAVTVSDWILATDGAFAEVDVSAIIRKGAQSTMIQHDAACGSNSLRVRAKGSSIDQRLCTDVTYLSCQFTVRLDNSAVFEARYGVGTGITGISAYAIGYTI